MPRTSPPASIRSEPNVARNVRAERTARGWTFAETARRMTEAGWPLSVSGLYKIERVDPPRRISVDELVGFAAVFETTVDDLLMPVEGHTRAALDKLVTQWTEARDAANRAADEVDQCAERLRTFAEANPDAEGSITAMLAVVGS